MKHLPAETVRLLSSSQVITSVVSVVKELIENSLDANATSVDVKLENYGFDKIEVRDNGDGIKATDIPVMAMKHYTSKICCSEDLDNLTTYGFRGEALGSICCTSEVLITTKTAADDFSTQYVLDRSGHITCQKPSHLGQGTTVTVLKLFRNLPVRKQFYSTDKKRKEELKRVQKLLMAYGIVRPELRIMFIHNKIVIWQKSRVSDHKMAFMAIVGTAVMGNMVPFQHCCKDPEISLTGFFPKPDSDGDLTSHSNSERSFIFINDRPVHQKEILKLTQQYYHLKPHGDSSHSFPIFFINITVPPSSVDVNLTPDKTQVLLHNKESVCHALDDVLTSLYGPVTTAVSCETKATDATSVGIFVNETEQTDVPANEIESRGNMDPHVCTSLFSFSNDVPNNEMEKNTEVCLKNQMLHNDFPHGLSNSKEVSGDVTARDDRFQDSSLNNLLCDEHQNSHKVIFDMDSDAFPGAPKNNTVDNLKNNHFQEGEKRVQQIPNDSSVVTADKWSLGTAFQNSTGGNLEPVQILIPEREGVKTQKKNGEGDQLKIHWEKEDLSIKKPIVVNDKAGQITPYDLIRKQIIRKPVSAFAFFTQDYRSRLLSDNNKASTEELIMKMEEMWESLNEEEKKKYEEKADKDLDRYNRQSRNAMDQCKTRPTKERDQRSKLKDCLANQQKLDKLFYSQTDKKRNCYEDIKTVQVRFSMESVKHRLCVLKQKKSDKEELCLINLQSFRGAWIMASEKKIMMLNPYRVEEAVLFKRLLENHVLAVQKLDNPIMLTDRLLGGTHYMEALRNMTKESVRFDGSSYFVDSRLVANGFKIKITPGASAAENQLEIEGMSNSLPWYGVSDLKEILSAVINNSAKDVSECRPLKVVNYLEGEAVRLSRQLPLYLSKERVQDAIGRMETQLGNQLKGCVHGRPFIQHLTDIPESS